MTLKMGAAFEFSLQLANHKPQRSDFGIVCKQSDIFGQKEGTTFLERVAFLLRLSIHANNRKICNWRGVEWLSNSWEK